MDAKKAKIYKVCLGVQLSGRELVKELFMNVMCMGLLSTYSSTPEEGIGTHVVSCHMGAGN